MAARQPPSQHQEHRPGHESEMTSQRESKGRPRHGSGNPSRWSSAIRVNGAAPGPVRTPLIASTFPPDKVAKFGQDVPMGRPS